jgi:hypothetical protein
MIQNKTGLVHGGTKPEKERRDEDVSTKASSVPSPAASPQNDFSTKFQGKAAEKLERFRIHRPGNS